MNLPEVRITTEIPVSRKTAESIRADVPGFEELVEADAPPSPRSSPGSGLPMLTEQPGDFSPSELRLPYQEWTKLAGARRPHLRPLVASWLARWNAWDLACSPMDDNARRQIRYGHFLGFFEGAEEE